MHQKMIVRIILAGWIVGGALGGLGLALYWEPMREVFRFGPLSSVQLLTSIAAAAVGLTSLELYKGLRRYIRTRPQTSFRAARD